MTEPHLNKKDEDNLRAVIKAAMKLGAKASTAAIVRQFTTGPRRRMPETRVLQLLDTGARLPFVTKFDDVHTTPRAGQHLHDQRSLR
jgi:hypothetical protein